MLHGLAASVPHWHAGPVIPAMLLGKNLLHANIPCAHMPELRGMCREERSQRNGMCWVGVSAWVILPVVSSSRLRVVLGCIVPVLFYCHLRCFIKPGVGVMMLVPF